MGLYQMATHPVWSLFFYFQGQELIKSCIAVNLVAIFCLEFIFITRTSM